MKNLILVAVLLAAAAGGYLLGSTGGDGEGRATDRSVTAEARDLLVLRQQDREEIDRLRAELARLRALLESGAPGEAPAPEDSVEAVERLLNDAYEENNVDWLLEVIERLLRMGERGYPTLRRLLEDIVFRAKFIPSASDLRFDQGYRFLRVFANLEKEFIGFLDYLLKEPRSHAWFRQGAMMLGAFYVGSKADGTEDLKQTMMQLFLADSGGVIPGIPAEVQRKMSVFAMAMSGDPRMIAPLRDELAKTGDEGTKSDILGALAYLGDPQAVPLIQERLNPAEGDFRGELRSLGRVGTDEAHATATDFLRAVPDGRRFYRHAREYVRHGGGAAAVMLIRERFEKDPADTEVNSAIGTLRRYPTAESLDTLRTIAARTPDKQVRDRASEAAADVDRRLRGEIPELK